MMRLLTTRHFKRDLKRIRKRGKDVAKLHAIVEKLLKGEPLPSRCRAHPLSGDWKGFRECHIEPDWLLIWKEDEDTLTLVRTGTHSDLF